jgi:hypothetical protein
VVALVLVLVLVAIPLYLWRRPRTESMAVALAGRDGASPMVIPPTETPPVSPAEPKLSLSEPRILACQDASPRKTPADRCDHLPDLEKAFARAIEESAGCVPRDGGGGTIQYVADVSFKRRTTVVTAPREGRSIKNPKTSAACAAAVKLRLKATGLDGVAHEHARYKLAITATYR